MNTIPVFENLNPDLMINAVESVTSCRMTGLLSPLPSYINRVYEMQASDGTRLIAKFYRPGRWSLDALKDEHEFVSDCEEDEIPVISPLKLDGGKTLYKVDGIYFTVFPKRFGREFEVISDDDWLRIGRLVARIHIAGSKRKADARIKLHPKVSTANDIKQLVDGGFVPETCVQSFRDTCSRILDISEGMFENVEYIRIHGDCHRGNLLDRPGEGIMVIDFDDMMTGPPIQDIWLLLPDHADKSRKEFGLILEGYRQFRDFDESTFRMIEVLRAMRIIYFLAWCSKQTEDYQFQRKFPGWGSDNFWKKEMNDLNMQLRVILEHSLLDRES